MHHHIYTMSLLSITVLKIPPYEGDSETGSNIISLRLRWHNDFFPHLTGLNASIKALASNKKTELSTALEIEHPSNQSPASTSKALRSQSETERSGGAQSRSVWKGSKKWRNETILFSIQYVLYSYRITMMHCTPHMGGFFGLLTPAPAGTFNNDSDVAGSDKAIARKFPRPRRHEIDQVLKRYQSICFVVSEYMSQPFPKVSHCSFHTPEHVLILCLGRLLLVNAMQYIHNVCQNIGGCNLYLSLLFLLISSSFYSYSSQLNKQKNCQLHLLRHAD